ncbi:hypothetical protein IFR05_006542 [Cadophora sp. M221]|nr:hypothetical protein IFR05_006542 [Cadophora sp. M221]
MSIGSHLYRELGPTWGNLYISVFICILINIVGNGTLMKWRDMEFNKWLIQHFQRLREHQYMMTEKYKEAKNDIAEVVWVCKAMELESLLSYPHEHTASCEKNCPLRYGDIFVVFGEERTGRFPPRSKANSQAGEELDNRSVAEYTGPYTEPDTTDTEDASPVYKRETSKPGENQSKQYSRSQSSENANERQEVVPDQKNGHINKLKRIKLDEHNKDNSALMKSDTQPTVSTNATQSPQVMAGVEIGKSAGSESQDNVRDTLTSEPKKAPGSPKVKGPIPQKKKAKKKW